MTREETLEAIKVMQHYADGGEVELYDSSSEEWVSAFDNEPSWIWTYNKYRIKKATKKIKLEAWLDSTRELRLFAAGDDLTDLEGYKRVPSEDKWVEVEE